MATLKRLRRRAGKRDAQDAERISLAPLTFDQAIKGALGVKVPETDQDEKEADNGSRP